MNNLIDLQAGEDMIRPRVYEVVYTNTWCKLLGHSYRGLMEEGVDKKFLPNINYYCTRCLHTVSKPFKL